MKVRALKRRVNPRLRRVIFWRACRDQYTLSLLDEATAKALTAQRAKWDGAFRQFVRDMAQPIDFLAAK